MDAFEVDRSIRRAGGDGGGRDGRACGRAGAGRGRGETARSAAGPTLTVRPRAARRGGRVVFYGEGFRPLVRVVLLAGPPASEAVKIGNAKTDEDGEFVAPIAIERRVRAGRYVALACRESCRVKASAIFRVLP